MSRPPSDRPAVPGPAPTERLRVVALGDGGLLSRIASEPVALAFRPVADVGRRSAVGYEAVLGVAGAAPRPPVGWSREAHVAQAGAVEARLVARALAARPEVPAGAFLVVKVSARALLGEDLLGVLEATGDLAGLLIGVLDDAPREDDAAVRGVLAGLRAAGAAIAADDTGSGYTSLQQLVRLRPDYVRIGGGFTSEVDRDPARAAAVEALAAVASRIDARVIATEIPGPAELHTLMRLGIGLVQGPVLGEVGEAMVPLGAEARAAIAAGQLPDGAERTVAAVAEPLAPLPHDADLSEVTDRFLEDPRHDFLVAVDEHARPVWLIERAAVLRAEVFEHEPMIVTPSSPLQQVARRLAARPSLDRLAPAVCCDSHGGYLGIVRVERVLDALAADPAR